MPQKTNLNVNPYYDDFDAGKNFYKVLFKPGFPVQSRELNTLQSILQNQVESFGSHIFKEGSMVIPGSITYDDKYFSVKINPEHLGINVNLYIDQLIDKVIRGQTSGVTAIVKNYSIPPQDNTEDITLYVKYIESDNDLKISQFYDGEILIIQDSIIFGNTPINAGDTVATIVNQNATAIGSAVQIENGIYFIRGNFVNVPTSTIVLDPYNNNVTYRVGLTIFEEIVTSNEDNSLNDNARGFSNFAAPGADRFSIKTILSKKSIDDFDDTNFIELIRIESGQVKKIQDKTVYSIVKDYLAKRTYEESGDYVINPFEVDASDSLNDRISNNGIYLPNQTTEQGNTPSNDLMCIKVSPGKAYVRGYDIDLPSKTIIDVDKPRETATVNNSLIPFQIGNLLRVNNVSGTPFIGIGRSENIIEFYNQRKNSTSSGTGNIVGKGRVYSFSLTDAAYLNDSTTWDLYLYDIQTYTELNVNTPLQSYECPESSYIRGVSSGASGYTVADAQSSTNLTLVQTSGTFIPGESILINESLDISRTIINIKQYTTEDIKSVYQNSNSISSEIKQDFVADAVLQHSTPAGFSIVDRVTITSSGTVTCPGKSFLGIRSDSILRYQISGLSTETYNRVTSVSSDGFSMNVVGVPSVFGVCNGALPLSTQSVTFSIGSPEIKNENNSNLFIPLNNENISSVNLVNSDISVTTQINELSTDSVGSMSVNVFNTGISSAFFDNFDSEKYSIFYDNGTIENLTSDQFVLKSGGSQIEFNGLLPNQSNNITLNATLKKKGVRSKTKNYIRSEKLSVTRTSNYASSPITGLSTSPYYGLRVEDYEISLNLPDVVNIVGVYESLNSATPILDKLTFISGLNLDTQTILGERIIGNESGAIAQLVTRYSPNEVEFVYLNSLQFKTGESVTFEESKITSNIQSITLGNYLNITSRYVLDKGQKNQYYDYSKLVRLQDTAPPSRQLLIIFNYYEIPSNDTGDFITVNSYTKERFLSDIPISSDGLRLSDTLDFRPRVARYDSYDKSPFTFDSKVFVSPSTYYSFTPNESSIIGYDYYLPRIDRLILNKLGQFSIIKGTSSINPQIPLNSEDSMSVAIIDLPAYLYNPNDVKITLVDNKRYTMRDIGRLEDRIDNLEITTSLSLLELNTKSLQIQDATGISRFKTGFFVDDFKNRDLIDKTNPDVKCNIDTLNGQLTVASDFWSIKPEIALSPSINSETADFSENLQLLDSNVRKTGDLITLDYNEISWLEQPLASNLESVNPFNISEYTGFISLNPASDNWVRNIYIQNKRTISSGEVSTNLSESNINIIINGEIDPYMRSRNVEFKSSSLRPLTQHYSFIDDTSSIDIIPKLIEISMNSGTFQTGETIFGFIGEQLIIKFRLAKSNHKYGPYSSPSDTYDINPYSRSSSIPSDYSASSTILNIDTFSLTDDSLTRYGGFLQVGAQLVGQTSGAVATVDNLRLVSDNYGDLIGSFFIKDPNTNPAPLVRIKSGKKIFKLSSSSTNSSSSNLNFISNAEAVYSASGLLRTQFSNVTQVRNVSPPISLSKNPLAQTFTVDETGAFLTSVDLFFGGKDPNEKLYVELRTVELGTPTNQLVQDYARVELSPDDINVSSDSSVSTKVTFPSPIYLQPRIEYALVLLCPTTNLYKVWIGTMGQPTVQTQNLPNVQNIIVTQQYIGGSLFKSQNGTIWTPNQYQDLKFKLYKAKFIDQPGDVVFYNPPLRPEESTIPYLRSNAIKTLPRKLRVGITTTSLMSNILTTGRKVSVGSISSPGAYGFVESVGGPLLSGSSGVSIANTGIGYSGGISGGSYSNVPLYTITGNGSGATADITIFTNGTLNTVSIANTGNGYKIGDTLGITTSNVIKGSGAKISVSSINDIDTLYLTNVQGEEFNSGNNLIYYEGNTPVSTASTIIRETSSEISPIYSGNVFEVWQYNHGMHGANNKVEIKNIKPDTIPIQLTANLDLNSTTISIANTNPFSTFEGISTSAGYVVVNNEIIYYNSINSNSLGIGTRGVDGSLVKNHLSGSICYKYEFNGVSLTKINTSFDMPTNSVLVGSKDLDKYYLQFNRSNRNSGDNQISFVSEKVIGGDKISASQNYQYSSIIPQFNIITPGQNTTVSAQMRTVSGTSAGGSEISFLDQNYEPVELNKINSLSTPRIICSEINEISRLATIPNNKSMTFRIRMSSTDSNLSPVIDTQNALFVLSRNRLNNPISNYATDGRVNLISGDPHSSIYISNRINLKQLATSLKVIVAVNRPPQSDFRVLYQTFKPDSSEVNPSFNLFPGYDNLRDTDADGFGDTIIDPSLNNGKPDAFVRSSKENEFLEYQFTANDLDPFNGFSIKIVMSSTNESQILKFKDIRVIALA